MVATREEKATITLGGQPFEITALTFDQLEKLLPAIEASGKPDMPMVDRLRHARDALIVALGKTKEEFGAMPMDTLEIIDALGVLTRLSGMVRLGEAMAARANAK